VGNLIIKPRRLKGCLCPECGAELYNTVRSVTISTTPTRSVVKSRIKQLEKETNLLKERVTLLGAENVLLRAEKEASYD
jgi:hypothetical protein